MSGSNVVHSSSSSAWTKVSSRIDDLSREITRLDGQIARASEAVCRLEEEDEFDGRIREEMLTLGSLRSQAWRELVHLIAQEDDWIIKVDWFTWDEPKYFGSVLDAVTLIKRDSSVSHVSADDLLGDILNVTSAIRLGLDGKVIHPPES